MLVGHCSYDEHVEMPRHEPDYEISNDDGAEERNSDGSNNPSLPLPRLEGSNIDILSLGVFWWLGSGANSRYA